MSEHEHLHPPKHGPPGHTPDEHDPDEHGGRVRERAAMLGKEPEELLDFSANVNFLGPTLPVVAAARRRRVGGSCGYQAISSMARRAAATTGRVGPKKFTLAEKSRSSSGFLPRKAARSRTRPPCSSGSCSSGVCPGGPCLGG